MSVLSVLSFSPTGQLVSQEMFGANAVFSQTEDGVPTAAYADAASHLGVQNIRFGGGQADLDPTRPTNTGLLPVDGETAIDITHMPNGALRPELVRFLDWVFEQTAAGTPMSATLVLPTKHLSVDDYLPYSDVIERFAAEVVAQYGDVISAVQIGNEHWEMGETAYGQKASIAAEALARGFEAAGVAEAAQPKILVQMATAGNAGSEFQATPGVQDFSVRNQAANEQVIAQLSDAARDAIDAVTEHYYYNRPDFEFSQSRPDVRNIDKDLPVWEAAFDKPLDLHITEWNIRTTATEQHGIVGASTLIKQFENLIALGADAANVWAFDYHSRTALTLVSDEGARLDEAGRLLNSPKGSAFALMQDALVGKELVTATFANTMPGVEISAYASDQEVVLYVSSRTVQTQSLQLDLSQAVSADSATGVHIAIDPETSNGKQWERGEAAKSIEVDGAAYFYNEHDVDVVLTDLVFDDIGDLRLNLKPFEVVQLSLQRTDSAVAGSAPLPDPVVVPRLPAPALPDFIGSGGDDLIVWEGAFAAVHGGTGRDTLQLAHDRAEVDVNIREDGQTTLTFLPENSEVRLTEVERLMLSDGILALDIEGAAGQGYRLYQASFARTPDTEGLKFWLDVLDEGALSLLDIASLFLTSDEFSETYGENDSLSDPRYLDLLYANVLGRLPDAEGYAFWQAQQENNLSRADMLVYFSESAENKELVAPVIGDGIWFP
ncbi:MAG: DUF4214 domain-containing protein [Pseudomonadota bacterium]